MSNDASDSSLCQFPWLKGKEFVSSAASNHVQNITFFELLLMLVGDKRKAV